ncbi:MAG: tetratricopeptide repeat protein [Syntrophaceae bacterium]|nr:tetratricopeptide repeat protein [Syntrophaceae bacterium]
MTLLSHALDWNLFGQWAGGHHLVSLLMHIAAVVLLFLFLCKTTQSFWPSAIVAALFALHPLRVESVAWAAERKDVLSVFFGMASLYAYAFYVQNKKMSKYFLSLSLFALSLMSKPMLVTLPCIMLLIDYWPLQRWQDIIYRQPSKLKISPLELPIKKTANQKKTVIPNQSKQQIIYAFLLEKIPFFILTIIFSSVALWAQNKDGAVASLDKLLFFDRVANALISYVSYLGKIFWPNNLALFYPYQTFLPMWQILGAFLFLLIVTLMVLIFIKRAPFLTVGWFWFLGSLVPVIGLVQIGKQAMADRYTYFPSIGIIIMLVWGLIYFFPKEKTRKLILAPLAVFSIAVLMFLTWQQCGYWKNSITVFRHALEVTKDNYLAHNNLGTALAKTGKSKEALSHYLAAVEINPAHDTSLVNLGAALAAEEQNEEAKNLYLRAIKANPSKTHAHVNLGNLLAEEGDKEKAMNYYKEAIKIDNNSEAYYNLANLQVKQGAITEAENNYLAAIKIDPQHDKAHYNLAELLIQKGLIHRAIEHFRESARLNPSSFKALNNLGVHLEKQQLYDEAMYYYRLAMKLEPENSGLHFNIGVALGNKGDLEKAIKHFHRAVELKPDYQDARRALKMALEMQNKN